MTLDKYRSAMPFALAEKQQYICFTNISLQDIAIYPAILFSALSTSYPSGNGVGVVQMGGISSGYTQL